MAIICFLRCISAQMTGKWLRIFSLCWTCGSAQTEAKIDTAVYNPSRITKLYGTIAAKGAHTPERPHRQSCIIRYPEQIRETPIALVKNIAAELHQAAIPTEARRSGKESTWDIEHFLSAHGVEVEKKVAISSGTKYQLAHCPFNDSHQHGDAAVFAYHQGGFGFHCFHNSCAGYHWHEFRQKVDPAAYSSSPYAVTPAVPTAKVSAAENSPLLGKAKARMLDFAEIPNVDRSKIVVIRSRLSSLDAKIGGSMQAKCPFGPGAMLRASQRLSVRLVWQLYRRDIKSRCFQEK